MTARQQQFYKLYMSGHSMCKIAQMYGVDRSTVCRTIARAERNLRDAERLALELREMGVKHGSFGN